MSRILFTWADPPEQVTPWQGTLPWAGNAQAGTPPWVGITLWAGTAQPDGTPMGRYPPWAGAPHGQVHPPGKYTPRQVPPGQVHHPRQVHPPARYTPMVNEWVVRILQECILVIQGSIRVCVSLDWYRHDQLFW